MKKREYSIRYEDKDKFIKEDLFTTLELVAFLVYLVFNKRIQIIEILEISFLED